MVRRNITFTVALSALLLSASAAWPQAGQATLSGTVTDATGALIPGAKAVLINESSKVQRSTTADKAGIINFIAVPPGTYDVLVSAPGFKPSRENSIAVHINDQLDLRRLTLAAAGGDQTVTVTSESGNITPTTSGEQSYTITDKQIQNLNIESRSAIELLDLIPGASNTGNFTGSYNREQAGFGQNASTYTVNGNRFDQVQIVSDGAPVTDLNTAGAAAVTPNVDMISEAKVETSAFSAVQPNGPIVFETQTKSGGSQYHGEAYLQARNHIFDSNDAYSKELGLPRANSSFYYPGFNIGGPILLPHSNFNRDRNKLFFFAAAEFTQQHVDLGAQAALVPTALMRTGVFSTSELSAIAGGSYRHYYQSNQPCSGDFYNSSYCSNGTLNPAAIDPGGLILINTLPLPNTDPSTNAAGNNLITEIVTSDPRNQENLKIDYNFSERVHFSGRFNHENENVPAPYGPYNTVNFAKIPNPSDQIGRNASNSLNFSLTNTITPSLTNQLSVAYTRFNLRISIDNPAALSRTASGYPYANVFPGSDLLPNISFTSTPGSYIPGGEAPPFNSVQNTTTVTDGITKILGRHQLQFGFYDVYANYNNQTTGNDNGTVTAGTYVANSTGNEFADLLVGSISGYSQSSQNIMAHMVNKRFDFYGEDTWKTTSRLTVNYGARLDHIAWWYDKNGQIAVFNPSAYDPAAPFSAYSGMQTHATNSAIPISGAKPLSFQFAPSVGFAYDIVGTGSTILRGGFGTNYYVDPGTNAFSAVGAPPNLKVFSFYSNGAAFTLGDTGQVDPYSAADVVYGSASPTDHQPAVTYSWNLALAHVFPSAIHVEASYVANTTRHLNGYSATNLVPLGSEQGPYFGTYYAQMFRPYPSFQDIGVNLHNLNSNYNSLQVTASHSKGWLNAWLTYTYGKALGYNCEDPFNEHNCYDPTPFDRSHAINFSYYIILPSISQKYLGNHKLGNAALDGWKISGIEQYGTGTPLTDVTQNGVNHNEYGGNAVIGIYGNNGYNVGNEAITGTPDEQSVPLVTCNPSKGLKTHQYFNPNCFAAPSQGNNGTFRLPYIHGPAYFNDELGIFKEFHIHNEARLEIRAQAFNFLNREFDNFQQYDSNLYLGFSNPGATPDNASTAGFTSTSTGHRSFQFAAKYYF
jgi:hypothetical protein